MTSTTNPTPDTTTTIARGVPASARARSRSLLVLGGLWALLLAVIATASARGHSLRDDSLALSSLAFFVVSAVIGSRVWLAFNERSART